MSGCLIFLPDANHDGKISLDEFKNIVVLVNKMLYMKWALRLGNRKSARRTRTYRGVCPVQNEPLAHCQLDG